MSDLQHPLKREIDKTAAMINEVHQLYNLYFQGVEKNQPHKRRQELDDSIVKLRTSVVQKGNAGLSFMLRQVDARYQMMKNRWDKTLAEIEAGTFRIPPKRK